MRRRIVLARAPRVRLGAVLAVALAAGFVTWLVVANDDEASAPRATPTLASKAELERLSGSLQLTLHWAGPRAGFDLELTQTAEGRVFVRYLPPGVAVGDPRPSFLAIATYPQASAFAELEAAARREGAVSIELSGGGLAVYDSKRPTSVYFSYPNADYQVEVYHPNASEARRLVVSGHVKRIS